MSPGDSVHGRESNGFLEIKLFHAVVCYLRVYDRPVPVSTDNKIVSYVRPLFYLLFEVIPKRLDRVS